MTDQDAHLEAIDRGIAYLGPRLVVAVDRYPDDTQLSEMVSAWHTFCKHVLALTDSLVAHPAEYFEVGDVVRVRGWGSREFRVTGQAHQVVEGSDEPRDLVCLESSNLWVGSELPEFLIKVRSAGGGQ